MAKKISSGSGRTEQISGDVLYVARRVYAAYPYRAGGDGVLARGGRIVAVGARKTLRAMASRGARVIDLGDGVLTPGLTDAHTHFFYWALQEAHVVDVTDTRSLEEAISRIRSEAPKRRVGEWVLGRGFDVNTWNAAFPTAPDLDRAVPDRPCMVRSRDGHVCWLNTAALRECGITARTADPVGGQYRRDARGKPNGLVFEAAIDALPNPLGDFARSRRPADRAAVDAALGAAYRRARELGFVGVHVLDDDASISTLQRHRAAGLLGLRVAHSVPFDLRRNVYSLGMRAALGDEWFRLAAIKIFSDGTLGSQTALMFDAYPGRSRDCGVPVVAGAALREAALEAARHGWPIWVHAIGDRAVSETIDAIAAARRLEAELAPRRGKAVPVAQPLLHRIEHTQCIRASDVRRMAKLGIIASVQPCHILGDIATARRYWPRVQSRAYAFRDLAKAGVTLAMGSDVPVEPIDPRRSFFAGVMRQDLGGSPAAGWFPQQRLTVREILRGFTEGAARSIGDVTPIGTLLPGAPADMTVWGADPLEWEPADLLEVPIHGSVLAGEVVV